MTKTRTDRIVTNEEIISYEPLVEYFLRESVVKNWKEASLSKYKGHITLGNSGYTMDDIRQFLKTELVVALKNYNPERKTKESSFVYTHFYNRIGQLMKALTRKKRGYGAWTSNLEITLNEIDAE